MKKIIFMLMFMPPLFELAQPSKLDLPKVNFDESPGIHFTSASILGLDSTSPYVYIFGRDTIIRGNRDRLIKYMLRQQAHRDSIRYAAEDILSTIRMDGYISDWKNFKKYVKEYQRIKNK